MVGESPAWHPSGRELFFLGRPDPTGPRQMMVVDFTAGPPVRVSRPRSLFTFERGVFVVCQPGRCYDVARDGQQSYAIQFRPRHPAPVVTHINLTVNWVEELSAKVPARR